MAQVTIDCDNDLSGIAEAAGSSHPDARSYSRGVLTVTDVSQDALDAAVAAYDRAAFASLQQKIDIAARRFSAEVAGVTIDGFEIYSDRTTQNKLQQAQSRALRDDTFAVDWKGLDGSFVSLDAATIIKIGDAMFDYVQACFTRESELVAAVNAGTYTADMLGQGWPSQELSA